MLNIEFLVHISLAWYMKRAALYYIFAKNTIIINMFAMSEGLKIYKMKVGLEGPSDLIGGDDLIEIDVPLSDEEVQSIIIAWKKDIKTLGTPDDVDYESFEWKGIQWYLPDIETKAREIAIKELVQKYGESGANSVTIEDYWIPESIKDILYELPEYKDFEDKLSIMHSIYKAKVHEDWKLIEQRTKDRWIMNKETTIGNSGGMNCSYFYDFHLIDDTRRIKVNFEKRLYAFYSELHFYVYNTDVSMRKALNQWCIDNDITSVYKDSSFLLDDGIKVYEIAKYAANDDSDVMLFVELLKCVENL